MQREQDALRVDWPGAYAAIPKDKFYRDDVYQRELNRIFSGPEWHPVGHRGEVPERGDFKSARIGEARVLVVHGDDGEIRVFVNSCPHRGTELVTCARGNAG